MKPLTIKLPQNQIQYDIEFIDTYKSVQDILEKQINKRMYLLVTDENVYTKSPFFQKDINKYKNEVLVLPAGESEKNWNTVEKILDKAFALELDRSAVFIVVGGGVYGDMVGFAASIFMRGVPFVQVPTSLLAMVDSSVGGKTGFDSKHGKNLIGAFHQPEKVICSTNFLETLPEVEIKNGLCEMIKHGIIASPEHFNDLQRLGRDYTKSKKFDIEKLKPLIKDSITIKKNIVEQDEKEAGIRGHLNLGHTFGHAIEHLSNFKIPHGQAVAMGCVMATKFACGKGFCDQKLIDQIKEIFELFDIPTTCEFSEDEIFNAMTHDKKKKDGIIRLILPREIGKVEYYSIK